MLWLLIASAGGALLISAICSLMEATLLSLTPSQLGSLSSRRPGIGGLWQRFKADIERPIAAILILNTAAHTIGASVAGAQFNDLYGEQWLWVFSLVFTFLMLQFTEIVPKSAGVRYNQQSAVWIGPPLALLVAVMRPIVLLVDLINRPFRAPQAHKSPAVTAEEIVALAGMARLSRQIGTDQERIIKRGSRLAHIKVREIMRPRIEVDALDVETPHDELVGAMAMSGFSRLPVYDGDLDQIVGFLYNKDLLLQLHLGREVDVHKLLRPAMFVPETLPVDQLLEMFRREHTQMAVVLDEYGGTEGIVTLEDLLEELVGEVYDELRRDEEPEIVAAGEQTWTVDGMTSLGDLVERIGRPELRVQFPPDVSSAGGLVQMLLDRVARQGDRVVWHGVALEVEAMDGLRIDRLSVRLAENANSSDRPGQPD